jgi:hypothetical protein
MEVCADKIVNGKVAYVLRKSDVSEDEYIY